MSLKRLAIPFIAVISLLLVAGALELFVALFAPDSEAIASEGASRTESPPITLRVGSAVIAEQRAEQVRQNTLVIPARNLVEAASIVVDGTPLGQAGAESLVAAAKGFTANVQFIDQRSVLRSGCELVAVAGAMNAEGIEASAADVAGYLRKGSDFSVEYLGEPNQNGGGFPPSVVNAANEWLASRGLSGRAHDLTGTTFAGVSALMKAGYPVVVWTTEKLVEPRFTGSERNGLRWYFPEHCVVVYGVEGDDVLVSDSLEGLVRRNYNDFARIYEACGNKAILIRP